MKREVGNIEIDVSRSSNGLSEFDGLFIQENRGKDTFVFRVVKYFRK